MKSPKKWGVCAVVMTLFALILLGGFTAAIDPVFHYHKPLPGLSYYLWDERYQNDGIARQFDYNAIITGTSMTENFRPSEMDALFGVRTVKTSFSGTTMREVGDHLRRAMEANEHIEMIVIGLDGRNLRNKPDELRSDEPLPTYLYDQNPFNDVSYLLNKDILLRYTMMVLQQTYYGNDTTSMDKYAYWWGTAVPGPETVLGLYSRREIPRDPVMMDSEEEAQIRQTVRKNVADLARDNPDVTFYCYFAPYSILYWDQMQQDGLLEWQLQAYRIAAEELLQYDNIRLYSYLDYYEWTRDLNNYSDIYHHSDEINSRILEQMYEDRGRITLENNAQYWDSLSAYLYGFDFDAYLAEWE